MIRSISGLARFGGGTLAALAVAFVLAHLPALPSSLEDIDSVNFALAVRDFDIARHRPHPPGYPVYVAAAKAAVAVGRTLASDDELQRSRIEARALSVLSLLGALLATVFLYRVFACLRRPEDDENDHVPDRLSPPWGTFDPYALAATALTVACPLFWCMSVRPMSDVPGLAAAWASLACLALAWWRQQPASDGDRRLDAGQIGASGRMIVLGSLLAAFAIGFRSQNAMLTVPFLLVVLVDRIGRGVAGAMIGSAVAFAVGGLLWAVPLVAASGGLDAYLAALGQQAGEDFAGVEMLYLNPTPRVAANALLRTLIYPWDSIILGASVLGLAAVGIVALMMRDRRALIALIALTVPYAIFHLLFQDMDFVRYALPLVPGIAFLAVRGSEVVARGAALPVSGALALWAVVIAAPVLTAYALEASPVVRALEAMRAANPSTVSAVLAMHQTFQRPLEAEALPIERRLASPPRREWLELVRYWKDGNTAPLWFLADPRRTDLALIDPKARDDHRDFAWHFSSLSQIGGMRPDGVNWYRLPPPGWFAEEGWALTPETAGIARSMQRGPNGAPIVAWVRRRQGEATMMVGGRHLGGKTDPPVTFTVSVDGRSVATWDAIPGFFLRFVTLPAGTLSGSGALARLEISSRSTSGANAATAIEQFDLQDAGSLLWGYDEGWHEAEYNPKIGLWRWTSEKATLRTLNASTAVVVRMQIESPARYFDAAPAVRITAADRVLANANPSDTSILEAAVPIDALGASDGRITIETNQFFVPAERTGGPDQRHLGLRVFGISIVRN